MLFQNGLEYGDLVPPISTILSAQELEDISSIASMDNQTTIQKTNTQQNQSYQMENLSDMLNLIFQSEQLQRQTK